MALPDSDELLSDARLSEIDLDELTRYIVRHHHDEVRRITPAVTGWLDTLVDTDGERHPELPHVRSIFASLADELRSHMLKEESILFPYIEVMAATRRSGGPLPSGPFGTILNPIRMMAGVHRSCVDRLDTLRRFCQGYVPPPDADTTYQRGFAELARFDAALRRYVDLENDVLFPRAIELEQQLG
jgi:regulator of cell morphogenesis and NO signaling